MADDSGIGRRKSEARRRRGGRSGFTTGACAAAAARAAAQGLARGLVPENVLCRLPNGDEVNFPVIEGRVEDAGGRRRAHAVVVKDAGDDPDVTNGAHLTVDLSLLPGAAERIVFRGGAGVGRVTREGLGLSIGEPAINPVPRRSILENIEAVAASLFDAGGLEVTVSVPGGEEMAKRTLNPRLGILGGISILGTTGIVRPYSTAAFRDSVIQAIGVAARQGQTRVVFTTGGRSERFAMKRLPWLEEVCFVQMGDFVKAAFSTAIENGMRHVYVGAMAGKLTKMAQGLPVTHAWRAEVDRRILVECAREAGAPDGLLASIRAAETARFAAERLNALGLTAEFHRALARRAISRLKADYPGDYHLTALVCDFDGEPIVDVGERRSGL
ncbi:MAG: cobalt-precorrin-5B (C(1))-methyltransferase [Candidatus Accumulibacter sp.]|jgi:cobalt-precorrin-5B (C1)-methyltransferase|nr:cobalt-precorrin-5B (C(1))-methyltransferase [Accumulibacter sp.]